MKIEQHYKQTETIDGYVLISTMSYISTDKNLIDKLAEKTVSQVIACADEDVWKYLQMKEVKE